MDDRPIQQRLWSRAGLSLGDTQWVLWTAEPESGSQALQSPEDHEATSGTELSHCLNLSLDLIVSVPESSLLE